MDTSLLFFVLFFSAALVSAKGLCTPSCGDVNISYPFHLKGDPSDCGDPDPNYELTCNSRNQTILNLFSLDYKVTNISYHSYYCDMYVIEVRKPRNIDTCSLPLKSLPASKVERSPYYELTYFNYLDWVSVVNCTKEVNNNSMYIPVPCLSRINHSFIYLVVSHGGYRISSYSVRNLVSSCSYRAMGPAGYYYGLHKFEPTATGFSLFHRPTKSFYQCLESSWKMFFNDTWRTHWWYPYNQTEILIFASVKDRVVQVVFGMEHNFFNCLNDNNRYIKNFNLFYRFSIVAVVLIQIVKLRIVLQVLGRFVFAPLTIYAFLCTKLYQMMVSVDHVERFLRNQQQTLMPTRYSYTDIIAMTGHFKEKLGQGGFGAVFKGRLPWDRLLAIKMLGNSKNNNGEEFINEVATIGRIHHVNVVKLIGYCSDGPQRALVYEYMPNGSLDKFIFSSKSGPNHKFSLDKLIDIALGVARGIDYLHNGCDMQILHFDIKPHNILLDHNFIPKVADFGLAKLYPKEYSLVSVSAARGTIGYIAPELISRSFGVISHKSDVYSFGMLLLEMAGGRRNADPRAENSSQVYYPSWIYDKLANNNIQIDYHDTVEIDANDVVIIINDAEKKLCMVGLWCIQMRPCDRPSMGKAIEMLEGDVHSLQMPPKPFFSSSTNPTTSTVTCLTAPQEELSTISDLSEDDQL